MKKRWLRCLGATFLGLVVLSALALWLTPLPTALTEPPRVSSEFLDRDGQPLRILLVDQEKRQIRICLPEISQNLIAATVAAEDKRFYHHPGFDFLATARALRQSFRHESTQSGASTISQQLIKLARPEPRTLRTKLAEIWLALRLESAWSKNRILEEYLNRLDYGNLQFGIAAASRYYFSKPASDLSVAESAFLAGLPKAPTRLDPHAHFDQARARQLWVLDRMQKNRQISRDDASCANEELLQIAPPQNDFAAPHFVDLLLKRQGILPENGGPILTTLDLDLNRFVEHTLNEQVAKLAEKRATSAAAVVLDNRSGQVLALASSGDYFQPGTSQINGAWTARSPGSAIKPFTYLLALEAGAFPGTVVPDVPTDFATPTGLYRPNNYNHHFYGPVSLRFALGNSLNVAAIQTLEIGGGAVKLHETLGKLGITTLGHPADYYGPGLTLGNAEMRLLEVANAYATLGRLGIYRPYRLLLKENFASNAGERVFSAGNAFLLADMLADNQSRAASFGENSWLHFDFPVACKTGTSSDYRDNWCIGYTPEFTVAVWVGNPDNSAMREITGVTGAGPVFHEIFVHLHQQRGTSWFNPPPSLQHCTIDPFTGHRVAANTPGAVMEFCQTPPPLETPAERDAQNRVILPTLYADWLKSPQNGLGNLVVAADSSLHLTIVSPLPGSIYFYDADLPANSQSIPLIAQSVGKIDWTIPSLSRTADHVLIRPGTHIVTALDRATGEKSSTWIEVRRW